uniref:uncharacterized protein LOC129518094 n=1 Tax=Nyctereutes procyonoides TaxID=34880 RepID=UPI002444AAF1|nr:uncharacterized protein LOC129518094 [Nyctereutes procyonoides]XP_055194093.1 uncharacterized protein LOC129518095 [Nyctereutes procyonoides]
MAPARPPAHVPGARAPWTSAVAVAAAFGVTTSSKLTLASGPRSQEPKPRPAQLEGAAWWPPTCPCGLCRWAPGNRQAAPGALPTVTDCSPGASQAPGRGVRSEDSKRSSTSVLTLLVPLLVRASVPVPGAEPSAGPEPTTLRPRRELRSRVRRSPNEFPRGSTLFSPHIILSFQECFLHGILWYPAGALQQSSTEGQLGCFELLAITKSLQGNLGRWWGVESSWCLAEGPLDHRRLGALQASGEGTCSSFTVSPSFQGGLGGQDDGSGWCARCCCCVPAPHHKHTPRPPVPFLLAACSSPRGPCSYVHLLLRRCSQHDLDVMWPCLGSGHPPPSGLVALDSSLSWQSWRKGGCTSVDVLG